MSEFHDELCAIARTHGYALSELRSRARSKPMSKARLACYVYLRERGWSKPAIGGLFNREHSTIAYWLDEDFRDASRARSSARYAQQGASR